MLAKFEGDLERCGFILKTGEIVECDNIASDPKEAFEVSAEQILQFADEAVATWHTHPNQDYNLSYDDHQTFLCWPNLDHYIVGTNGLRRYYVENGDVLID